MVTWTAIPHGYLYMVLLITAIDLGRRARWSWRRLILIALAGTVPFLSFVAERSATKDVRAKLAAESAGSRGHAPSSRNSRYIDLATLAAGDQADDAIQVLRRGEVDDDPALGAAHVDPHPGVQVVGQPQAASSAWGATTRCRGRRSAVGAGPVSPIATSSSIARTDIPSATTR